MTDRTYFWSEDEVSALKSAYASSSGSSDSTALDRAVASLPGKSRGCIAAKACRLGITTPRNRSQMIVESCKPKPHSLRNVEIDSLDSRARAQGEVADAIIDLFS